MASQIITLPTITVTSGTAVASVAWDISDAVGVSFFTANSTAAAVQIAFAASSDATFVSLGAPWQSNSTASVALVTSSANAYTLAGIVAKQMRFLSSGTVSAGYTVIGSKAVSV